MKQNLAKPQMKSATENSGAAPRGAPKPLTARQLELFEYLKEKRRVEGIPPSTREIQNHFGFASQTAVIHHLRALELKGAIERLPGKARALRLVDPDGPDGINDGDGGGDNRQAARAWEAIPLLGAIPAGAAQLREAVSQKERKDAPCVTVDRDLLGIPRGARTFALRVSGDSMTGAHILDGDVVIMEFREPANGDIVAALIDGETTLKRYIQKGGKAYLKSENPAYPDLIPARELVIQGVLIALLRGRVGGHH